MNYRRDLYPTGRKHCSRCRRWRPVIDFGRESRNPGVLKARCHACLRTAEREARGYQQTVGLPYGRSRQERCHRGHPLSGDNLYVHPIDGYRRCRTCLREGARRSRNTELGREYKRIYSEAKRREQGIRPIKPISGHAPQGLGERLRIPARPFTEWLERHAPTRDRGEWAVAHEIDDSAISKILSGKYETVHIDTVDRCLRYEKESLFDLYPELYEFDDDLVVAA